MSNRILKLAIAVSLLALLLHRADWAQASRHLAQISPQTLVGVLIALLLGLVLSACKWSCALKIQALNYPFGMLLRVLCIGFFFNSFLPTAVGGDAYRVYRTLPPARYRSRAVAAVVLERAVGLLALLTLGGLGAIVLFGHFAAARLYVGAAMTALVVCAVAFVAVERGWLESTVRRWRPISAVDALLHSIGLLKNQRSNWLLLAVLSVAFQMISIGVVFALFRDVTTAVTLAQCAVITALVGIAAAVPISINGIGVMEGAFVATALALGLDYEQALVVAIERRFIAVLLSALCGVVYLVDPQNANAPVTQRRLSDALRKLRDRYRAPAALVGEPSAAERAVATIEPDVPLELAGESETPTGVTPKFSNTRTMRSSSGKWTAAESSTGIARGRAEEPCSPKLNPSCMRLRMPQ